MLSELFELVGNFCSNFSDHVKASVEESNNRILRTQVIPQKREWLNIYVENGWIKRNPPRDSMFYGITYEDIQAIKSINDYHAIRDKIYKDL